MTQTLNRDWVLRNTVGNIIPGGKIIWRKENIKGETFAASFQPRSMAFVGGILSSTVNMRNLPKLKQIVRMSNN